MSNENLAAREPLLMMAENNNNGDINGNSNMEDNNNLMVNRNVVAAGEPGRGLGPTPPLETSTPSPPANYPGLNRTRYSDTTSSTETEEEEEERGRL
jgi:hypothetical protein